MASEAGISIAGAIERLQLSVQQKLRGGVTWKEAWQILTMLIKEAETIYGAARGKDKHAAVKGAWQTLDNQYGLIKKLDDAVQLPGVLELLDYWIFKYAIDLFIMGIVEVLNMTIWKKNED